MALSFTVFDSFDFQKLCDLEISLSGLLKVTEAGTIR